MIPSRQFFKLGVAYIPLFGSESELLCLWLPKVESWCRLALFWCFGFGLLLLSLFVYRFAACSRIILMSSSEVYFL
ncbi:hypothetical protein MIMGU_mgv1a017445mg [Erythranthe guttata]|uniref:Uncharacterized protein n=1 Tax=Erythranthe guttata TaxID=4155 RepID=A0A022Q9P2_ERYGU|nr:hypothetical protein MIMGU_mgv1a017445mg [Erythranthe guttata]